MADLALLPFELPDRFISTIRALVNHNASRKLNKLQIDCFNRLLADLDCELKIYQYVLSSHEGVSNPQKSLAELFFKQCTERITNLNQILSHIKTKNETKVIKSFPTAMKDLLSQYKEQLVELQGNMEKLHNSLGKLYDTEEAPKHQSQAEGDDSLTLDRFKTVNMVPSNPVRIVLDFNDNNSPECQLKTAIFDDQNNATVVASGMGGVGKTCALRGVGLHGDASLRFPGGVLYMSLGAESSKAELIRNIANVVRRTGGIEKSREIEVGTDLSVAVNLATEWFRRHVCLFLIDDVWCQKGIDSRVTEVLSGIAANKLSRVAFTTRDITLHTEVEIKFTKRAKADAEKILRSSAGMEVLPQDADECAALQSIFKMTDGLPIALNVVGSRAWHLMKVRNVNPLHVWSYVSNEYDQSKTLLSGTAFRNDKNENVLNVLLMSLQMIDKESGNVRHKSIRMFSALSILQKRQEVPFDVLERIWGLSSDEVRSEIEIFERFSIVEIFAVFQGQKRSCFIVHDLLLDLSRHLAEKEYGCIQQTSARVINSYVTHFHPAMMERQEARASLPPGNFSSPRSPKFVSMLKRFFSSSRDKTAKTTSQQCTESNRDELLLQQNKEFHESWVTLEDDGFARRNVFRLLYNAKMHDKGLALLRDPRWIVKQTLTCKWKQVDDDILQVLKHIQRITRGESETEEETFLKMLRGALAVSERHIFNSQFPGMIWTQLYGRMFHYKDYFLVRLFLSDIERYAQTPWFKSQGAFPAPTPSSGKVLDVKGVRLLRYASKCVEFIVYDEKGRCFHLQKYTEEDDTVRVERTWSIPSTFEIDESDGFCQKHALNKNGTVLAFGGGSSIFLFDHSMGEPPDSHNESYKTLKKHEGEVTSLAMNDEGNAFVSGAADNRLIMWKRTEIGTWQPTAILDGHTAAVRSVAMSKDCHRIVSGAEDNTVRIWDLKDDKWVSIPLEGHFSWVHCLTIAENGKSVVSGSFDRSVRLWQMGADKKWSCKAFNCDDPGNVQLVYSVGLGNEGHRIVSGSHDGLVRAWELTPARTVPTEMNGHSNPVRFLAMSSDERKVVSCADDSTLRLWEFERNQWVCTNLVDGHMKKVRCLAISGDHRRVCSSLLFSSVVRVWETSANGQWLSTKLNGKLEYGKGMTMSSDDVDCVAMSYDGRRLATGSYDGSVCIWELKQSAEWVSVKMKDGHERTVTYVTLSDDGCTVASISNDESVRVWEEVNGEWKASTLVGPCDSEGSVILSGDGLRLHAQNQYPRGDEPDEIWYEKRDGVWTKATGVEVSNAAEEASRPYGRADWPHGFQGMEGIWSNIWEVSDGGYCVAMNAKPYMDFLRYVMPKQ